MRKDGGGLICTAIDPVAAQKLGLPFASDVLEATHFAEQKGDIPYDRKNHSSFSLWVNHKKTFTGITDNDRALTVTAIAEQVKQSLNGGGAHFSEFFRTPGHCAILRAADGLLDHAPRPDRTLGRDGPDGRDHAFDHDLRDAGR